MKLVEARISEDEYRLLRKAAKVRRKPVGEIVREAVQVHLSSSRMDPNDPIFSAFPLVPRKKGRHRENVSGRLDELLYGSLH